MKYRQVVQFVVEVDAIVGSPDPVRSFKLGEHLFYDNGGFTHTGVDSYGVVRGVTLISSEQIIGRTTEAPGHRAPERD